MRHVEQEPEDLWKGRNSSVPSPKLTRRPTSVVFSASARLTGTSTLQNIDTPFLASMSATSCGVDTMTAPALRQHTVSARSLYSENQEQP